MSDVKNSISLRYGDMRVLPINNTYAPPETSKVTQKEIVDFWSFSNHVAILGEGPTVRDQCIKSFDFFQQNMSKR